MAKTLSEALMIIMRNTDLDVYNMEINSTEDVVSNVNHTYKKEIIVPYIGISNNIKFLLTKGDRYVVTVDGEKHKVLELKESHICELSDKVEELYHIGCWDFIKKWYQTKKGMDSLHFVYLKLE